MRIILFITQMEYDPAGNKKLLNEPNAGINTYTYDAFGRLIDQVDGKGNHLIMKYDMMGRITNRNLASSISDITTYTYNDDKNVNGFGELINTSLNEIIYTYRYDVFNRLLEKTESFQGNSYTSEYTYDIDGNIETYTYPGGLKLSYEYMRDGSLALVRNAVSEEKLWTVVAINNEGQLANYALGNGLNTSKVYDNYGFITSISTGKIQNLNYDFNRNTGNLNWRKDLVFNLEEKFTYDDLLKSRLDSWQVTGLESYGAQFEDNGNIYQKDDVTQPSGTYDYGNGAGPHAITSVLMPKQDYMEHATNQNIQYTAFNKTKQIDQQVDDDNYTYFIDYGPDNARKTSVLYKNLGVDSYKFYVGNYEVEVDNRGNKRELNYISGGDGIFAVYVTERGINTQYYLHKDHLGSFYCITDQNGEVVNLPETGLQYFSFDPWGRLRNPFTWDYTTKPLARLFSRGFTGHEHLDLFGLINMNGRTYDPWLGRMLQPDNYVQEIGNSQNFNRYSYVLNNPLKYTDPSGEFYLLDSWFHGFIDGFFSTNYNKLGTGLAEGDRRANIDAKITEGLLFTDPNKKPHGQVWEIISRVTWQAPQTTGGWLTTQWNNTLGGNVNWVKYKYGSTVVQSKGSWGGITQGPYIMGDESIEADANNPLFQHEYGHYIQSQSMGMAYYPRIGIPSAYSDGDHNFHAVEQDANRRAFLYFNKHVDGFYVTEQEANKGVGWSFSKNPLDVNGTDTYGQFVDYRDETSLATINSLKVHANFFDHVSWLFIPAPYLQGRINY